MPVVKKIARKRLYFPFLLFLYAMLFLLSETGVAEMLQSECCTDQHVVKVMAILLYISSYYPFENFHGILLRPVYTHFIMTENK